ncbi:MAG: ATP-binding protein [Piscinibacter sp.]|uniref:AAA family ATPase n=1 Tax=Piscinibacter sp. TaxID=1903157 RepID=UPI002583E405|nr:ATP-binding protein [Piscinibacter sp.]MCW5666493.1 ATP-binding protein [Piscinibacter sp.]
MRNKIAVTKNVGALLRAYESLAGRDPGIPGIGLVHGYTGAGKSTATAWLVNRTNGVYLRAAATWTPSAMLGRGVVELGGEAATHRGASAMVDYIVRRLAEENRPLFVDEADYLFRDLRMLETLRDIHDLSAQPVVMIGMEGIARRLKTREQLSGRISQWVEFLPADLEDARTLATTVCEVTLDDELLERLHAEAKGSMRLMAVGLARIESLAKGNGWKSVSAEKWGDRRFFFGAPGADK